MRVHMCVNCAGKPSLTVGPREREYEKIHFICLLEYITYRQSQTRSAKSQGNNPQVVHDRDVLGNISIQLFSLRNSENLHGTLP